MTEMKEGTELPESTPLEVVDQQSWSRQPSVLLEPAPPCGPDEYLIHLSSWIIQDGNYGEFAVAEQRSFALEFWLVGQDLQPASGPASVQRTGTGYDVVAATEWWGRHGVVALHFGVSAYVEPQSQAIPRGAGFVRGRIQLGVDPFPYFETLSRVRGAPPLIYDWSISGLYGQAAPYVEQRPKMFVRDSSALRWEAIAATDAWNDDNGSADYLLRARPLGLPRHRLQAP